MPVAVTVAAAACATEQSEQLPVVVLEELGVEYVAGADEAGPADAVLRLVLDAAIPGDTLAVLDASPPYVKLFDGVGRFVGTRVNRGEGPGEARQPIAIGRAGPRGLLVTEHQLLDNHPDGRLVLGTRQPVSSVAVIRTETLLDAIRERGIDRPVGGQ